MTCICGVILPNDDALYCADCQADRDEEARRQEAEERLDRFEDGDSGSDGWEPRP
jgi:hypothetical protein